MAKIKHRGLYRTPENSYVYITLQWKQRRASLVNIVTGDRWFMPLDAFRTMRYLSRLTFTGALVKRWIKPISHTEAAIV